MSSPRHKARQLSKVNQAPRGLQSLLGNVNQGMNPDELDNVVSGGVDLLPFWGVDKVNFAKETNITATPTAASRISLAVPEGEVWMPIVVNAYCTMRIGDIIRIGILLRQPNGQFLSLGTADSGTVAATNAELLYAGGTFNRELIVTGGFKFTAEVQKSEIQTGTISLTAACLYYKLAL